MTDAEVKTSHEDVVDALRKAVVDTTREFGQSSTADEVLKLAQAYERVAAASGYDY